MFKKTLLALAMAGVAGTASAATITVPAAAINVSSEGFASQTAAAQIIEVGTGANDVASVTIDLGSALITNDVVEITFTGATVNAAASTPVLVSNAPGGAASYLDVQDNNTIRFRVTTDFADTENAVLTGVTLVPTSSADGAKISVSSTAISSSSAIGAYDPAKSTDVAVFDAQLKIDSTLFAALSATIDVATSRTEFTVGATSGTAKNEDTLFVDLNNQNTLVDALALTTVTHTVVGTDLSYINDFDLVANGGDGDGVLDQAEMDLAVIPTAQGSGDDTYTVDVDVATNTVTIVQTVVGGAADLDDTSVAFKVTNDVVIPEQAWTGSVVGSTATASATAAPAGTSLGSWTNNGTTFHVPVMTFNAQHSNLIIANNRSALDAVVELVLYIDGTAVNVGAIGTIEGNNSLNLSSAIADAVAANNGGSLVGFDLVFEGTANAIDISAQYVNRTSGSRAVVQVTEL